jgi:glutamine synthetase
MRIGVDVLPNIPKDTTDRNRTSPLAFTGNKFELRMLGSSMSISGPNIALNTIMAEELGAFADILEQAEDFDTALQKLVCDTFTAHQRILFNGNCYANEWKEEAARRGLSNLPSTADALTAYLSPKNIELVTKHGIFTEAEFHARYEIYLQAYCKIVSIEARTTADMVIHQILPAAMKYTSFLCEAMARKTALGLPCKAEKDLIAKLSTATDSLYEKVEALKVDLTKVPRCSEEASHYYHRVVVSAMDAIRLDADLLEQLTDKAYWPYPTYSDLLFY